MVLNYFLFSLEKGTHTFEGKKGVTELFYTLRHSNGTHILCTLAHTHSTYVMHICTYLFILHTLFNMHTQYSHTHSTHTRQ